MSDVREQIVNYLQRMADAELGTVLSKDQQEVVGWCASWVRNKLDEAWVSKLPSKDEK